MTLQKHCPSPSTLQKHCPSPSLVSLLAQPTTPQRANKNTLKRAYVRYERCLDFIGVPQVKVKGRVFEFLNLCLFRRQHPTRYIHTTIRITQALTRSPTIERPTPRIETNRRSLVCRAVTIILSFSFFSFFVRWTFFLTRVV